MTPPIGKTFRITSWRVLDDLPGVEFSYHCDVYGPFRESVVFPMLESLSGIRDGAEARIVHLLHAALGASYYKCAAARTIRFDAFPQDADAEALVEAVYGPGLGEFFVRVGLGFPYPVRFDWGRAPAGRTAPEPASSADGPSGDIDALVGFGGGKDSYVAMDLVRKAVKSARFFKIRSHLEAPRLVPAPEGGMFAIDRFLDPRLRDVNAAGAFNGHVPVTAMNSLIALLAAKRLGGGPVIFANERSADEATAELEGHAVNHQYSKSFEMERLIAKAVSGPGQPNYFSLLRPVSEVWIARHLAGLPELHDRFMSCNRNFRIGNRSTPVWCGACAKCAFTFLLFAPFLPKARLVEIFGKDLLDDPALLPVFEELTGLREVKPWDCVGTVEECRTVLGLVAQRPEWAGDKIVAALAPRLQSSDPERALGRLLALSDRHNVPEPFLTVLKQAAD